MQIGLNLALTLEHGGAGAPTLDMTFTGTGNALDSRITFTRASGATWFNSAGVLQGVDFSVTSNTIGTGSKTFTLTATGGVNRYWTAGDTVLISDQTNSANNMVGTVTSYNASTQVLVCNITSTGGSGTLTAWRIGSTMPRFDYNPATLAAQGLLIEEARTNSIRNNTMQGAVAGTPGTLPTNWTRSASPTNGISSEIIGVGTQAGVTYVDIRFYGTATATSNFVVSFEASNQISAAPSQSWTGSLWARIISGSIPNQFNTTIQEFDSGNNFLRSSDVAQTVTTTWQRFTQTVTTGASCAFVRPVAFINYSKDAVVNVTLRIGLPQLEQGAFATSVIPTTTTALTRSADVASVNTLSPWFNSTEGGIFVEWQSTPTLYARYLVSIEQAGTSATRIDININSVNAVNPRTVVGGAAVASLTGGTYTGGGIAKIAFGYKSADYASSFNGAAAVTATTAGALPSSLATMYLGSITGGTPVNGWLRRFTYYPRRPSNAELVTLST